MQIQPHPNAPQLDLPLFKAAQALEARFLKEMLKAAGLGEVPEAFGGGIGEEQFASFLQDKQAEQMVAAGGIGLAQSIYEALLTRRDQHEV